MRKIEITYELVDGHLQMHLEDTDGQYVDVEFNKLDGKAYFSSMLHGDEIPVYGSCALEDAETEALFLMGIPTFTRMID